MYDAGDICRWNPNGEIDFLGRGEVQVNVRGIRVELEEMEHALSMVRGVTGGAVRIDTSDPSPTIRAAVTGSGPSAMGLRRGPAKALPAHLMPSTFEILDQLTTRSRRQGGLGTVGGHPAA